MSQHLAALVERFPSQKILVVGDLLADEFVFGEIARVSREAPVLILRYERTETMPGGAGNTAANLAALGVNTSVLGIVGRDRPGRMLTLSLRERGVNTRGILAAKSHVTPTKTRVLAGSAHAPRQQVIRVDREDQRPLPAEARQWLLEKLQVLLKDVSAVILSDYNYGVVDATIIEAVRESRKNRPFPVVADSRFRLREFWGLTSATPNEAEAEELCNERFTSLEQELAQAEQLRKQLQLESLILTRGPEGMILVQEGKAPTVVDAVGSKDPVDVTGAGDTVIATYTAALAAGAGFVEAMHLANHAAGQVVMKRGTATISRQELLTALSEDQKPGLRTED
ncbi:MAG: bifunctional hydroxymethylpyrimidine kinase/phosphomethylpyrimidine kinase [Blastocatellia bacterium]|nr:bifunctional hydroxymethylpyrimidine kinase/phosphomethylpyrimidine kinase [Blastocatellia bacterium]